MCVCVCVCVCVCGVCVCVCERVGNTLLVECVVCEVWCVTVCEYHCVSVVCLMKQLLYSRDLSTHARAGFNAEVL